MRIALEHLEPVLADALSDLLRQAGHDVSHGSAGGGGARLTIRGLADGRPTPPGSHAVLCLRPDSGRSAAVDPAAALRAALLSGGEVAWEPPLEPSRLLDVIASVDPVRAGVASPLPPRGDGEVLGSARDPWFRLDVATGELEPLNHEARASEARGGGSGRPSAAVLAAVSASDEGRRLVEDEPGREALALWWTPWPGQRIVGWIPWRRVEQAEDRGTLKALAELGRISSTFAHEVRNPLASLVSALDLLRGPITDADRSEVLAMAQVRVGHLRQLLDDTLRLVRAFRGPPLPVDLVEVIASARALARSDPLFAGIELRVEAPTEPPQPLSYAEPLRQALTNLLMNAAQSQGHAGRIVVRVEVPGPGRAVVAVLDEGPGIPPAQRQRVFEPFWTTKHHGTGLGLAFVRRVAEASGGIARVADVGPPGARVELDLPTA